MRLIDVDALKARIDQEVKEDKVLSGWAFFFKVYLDEASSIDIVWCKECKHWENEWCYWRNVAEFGDAYCSHAHRAEQTEPSDDNEYPRNCPYNCDWDE